METTKDDLDRAARIQLPPINKRRETMADGRRYIIYYTFATSSETAASERAGEIAVVDGKGVNHV